MINHLRRRSGAALVAAGALVALTACSTATADAETQGAYPLTIENCGADLEIASEPTSVLTIGTSAIALLDTAGASDRITARSGEFGADLPEGLENPPTDAAIVDPSDPTAESIIGAEPDIIVGYGLFNAAPEDIAAAGIPEIVIDGECSHDAALTEKTDFDAIFADVDRLATVFGTEAAADANLEELRAELDELTAAASTDTERGTAAVVYYFSESSTLSARGGQGIADDVLDRAGFDNVYGDEPSVYLEVNVETLLDADPDTIVLAYGLYGESFEDAKAHLLSEPGVTDLEAVKADRIIGVPASDLSPDPGALRGLRAVLEGTGRLSQ
ncbi:ABC transporter substrate-binding protein [Microbacterium sp. RD1]|uniref:ABC transporter substrate-binding protein n=1 Tax=Microbacterium sp. RD1 TaxID=3457313 RepID=UPI003FA56DB9